MRDTNNTRIGRLYLPNCCSINKRTMNQSINQSISVSESSHVCKHYSTTDNNSAHSCNLR